MQATSGLTSQAALTINVVQVDRVPVFAAGIFNYTVPEGTAAGAALSSALPIASSNPNARNVPVYRLLSSNPPTTNFVVDPISGALSLWAGVAGGALLYNASAAYPLPNTYILAISAQVSTVPSLFANATVYVTGAAPSVVPLSASHAYRPHAPTPCALCLQ